MSKKKTTKKAKVSRTAVMKRAHSLKKRAGATWSFGKCLKNAWRIEKANVRDNDRYDVCFCCEELELEDNMQCQRGTESFICNSYIYCEKCMVDCKECGMDFPKNKLQNELCFSCRG